MHLSLTILNLKFEPNMELQSSSHFAANRNTIAEYRNERDLMVERKTTFLKV